MYLPQDLVIPWKTGILASIPSTCRQGRQTRFHRGLRANNSIALLVDGCGQVKRPKKKPPNCQKKQERKAEPLPEKKPYTIWITPFGEYAREKEQNQTPAFSMGLGGALAAFEWSSEKNNVFGFGAAYVYSHVHSDWQPHSVSRGISWNIFRGDVGFRSESGRG